MTTLTRTKSDGAWSTTEDVGGGGGGDLPDWWTVDSTPGDESVIFNGYLQSSGSGPLLAEFYDTDGDYGLDVYKRGLDVQGDGTGELMRVSLDAGAVLQLKAAGGLYITPRGDVGGVGIYVDGSQSPDIARLLELDSIDGPEVFKVGPTGAVTISPSADDVEALRINGAEGATLPLLTINDFEGNVGLDLSTAEGFRVFGPPDGVTTFKIRPAGTVLITPTDGSGSPFLNVEGLEDQDALLGIFATWDGQSVAIDANAKLSVNDGLLAGDAGNVFSADPIANKLGFFKSTAVVKPTGVAVTAGGIHAALVTLGLIAA